MQESKMQDIKEVRVLERNRKLQKGNDPEACVPEFSFMGLLTTKLLEPKKTSI